MSEKLEALARIAKEMHILARHIREDEAEEAINVWADRIDSVDAELRREIATLNKVADAAMQANANRELLEAKIAAMEEANKELAGEYRKSELKFNLLVDAVGGAERAKKLIEAADLDKTAAAMKELAEKHRKEAEGGAP